MKANTEHKKNGPMVFLTIPNLLSLIRLLSAPFIFLFFTLEGLSGRFITLGFLLVVFSTDFFDGLLARTLNQKSDMGRMLDPLADKAVVIALLICLVLFRSVNIWAVIGMALRDILILFGGLFLKLKKKIVVESNIWGKAATFVLMASFLAFIFEALVFPAYVMLFTGLALALISLVTYVIQFINTIRD